MNFFIQLLDFDNIWEQNPETLIQSQALIYPFSTKTTVKDDIPFKTILYAEESVFKISSIE